MFSRLFAAIFAVGLLLAAPPLKAATKITLTPEIKARLMALKPLRGNAVNRAALDGRPVLVTFFASW